MGFFRFLGRKHAYTSADIPWRTDDEHESRALFRYLRGGGMRCFGSTAAQDVREHRQNRFLALFAIGALGWLLLWIF